MAKAQLTTLEDAHAQLTEFGLEILEPEVDAGVKKAIFCGEKRARKSGWYSLISIWKDGKQLVTGTYGAHRLDGFTRYIKRNVDMSDDRNAISLMQKRVSEENRKEKERQKVAAVRAKDMWGTFSEDGESRYLTSKKLSGGYGEKYHNGTIVIPMFIGPNIVSLQLIKGDGFKKYLKDGVTSGASFVIEGNQERIALCEGFATGASIHEATGWTVVVCFTASGLPKVAPYFKKVSYKVVICADNDERTEAKTGKNTGIICGSKARDYLGCPIFAPSIDGDWNDVHVKMGLEEVKRCLM